MTTRKRPPAKKRRPAPAPAAVVEPVVQLPTVRETHESAIQKPGLVPRGMA